MKCDRCDQPGIRLVGESNEIIACIYHARAYDHYHEACGRVDQITTCGMCEGVWCDRCDPAHGPLCPWCHGMGYSTAAIKLPRYRQANHVLHNGGYGIDTNGGDDA